MVHLPCGADYSNSMQRLANERKYLVSVTSQFLPFCGCVVRRRCRFGSRMHLLFLLRWVVRCSLRIACCSLSALCVGRSRDARRFGYIKPASRCNGTASDVVPAPQLIHGDAKAVGHGYKRIAALCLIRAASR